MGNGRLTIVKCTIINTSNFPCSLKSSTTTVYTPGSKFSQLTISFRSNRTWFIFFQTYKKEKWKRCRNDVPKSTQTMKDKSDGKNTKPHPSLHLFTKKWRCRECWNAGLNPSAGHFQYQKWSVWVACAGCCLETNTTSVKQMWCNSYSVTTDSIYKET